MSKFILSFFFFIPTLFHPHQIQMRETKISSILSIFYYFLIFYPPTRLTFNAFDGCEIFFSQESSKRRKNIISIYKIFILWLKLIINIIKIKVHFQFSNFGIVFILVFYIIKFSFWSFMFDSIFCLVFYVSKFLFSRLKAEKKKKENLPKIGRAHV